MTAIKIIPAISDETSDIPDRKLPITGFSATRSLFNIITPINMEAHPIISFLFMSVC